MTADLMELRYLLAVVTGSGAGPAREVAVALSRAGVAVLCVDPDGAAAQVTADVVRRARVTAWDLRADLDGPDGTTDARLVAARGRDLGGADLVVVDRAGPAADLLIALVATDAALRPARRLGTPRFVKLDPEQPSSGAQVVSGFRAR